MPHNDQEQPVIKRLSILFVAWFTLWLLLLILLPHNDDSTLFYLLGIAPVVGWFAIKPRRISWFFATLLGTSGLDR